MYTLRLPFKIPQNKEIQIHEESGKLEDLTYTFKKQDSFYVFTISGFPTKDSANKYINNVWAGLMWILLHRGLSPEAVFELSNVVYAKDPYQAAKSYGFKAPIDGFIDGSRPAVYLTGKRIVTETAGNITVFQTYPIDMILNFFQEGVSFPSSAEVIQDSQLMVSLELYGAFFTEVSVSTKFLTLVMALEALSTSVPKTQLVLNLMDKWKEELDELQKTTKLDSEDSFSLESLSRELSFRKGDSIGQQIRNLVFTTLKDNGDEDALEMSKKFLKIYNHRSTLIHKGKLDSSVLGKATSDAKNIVERVLKARFLQKARKNPK